MGQARAHPHPMGPIDLHTELTQLRGGMVAMVTKEEQALECVASRYRASAENLLHFIAFHSQAHPNLAGALRDRGLSTLAGCDAHLMASLEAVISALEHLEGRPSEPRGQAHGPFEEGRRRAQSLMGSHCDQLFGPGTTQHTVTIMVTLPAAAAEDDHLIPELVDAGMTIARINCAHDSPAVWEGFVSRVRQAVADSGRSCRIAMDLAGPKLRTGELPPLPGVIRIRPLRDRFGRVLKPARVAAVPDNGPPPQTPGVVQIPTLAGDWGHLEVGDRLLGRDASGRQRELRVIARDSGHLLLECDQGCRFISGSVFSQQHGRGRLVVAKLPPGPGQLVLHPGDTITLTAAPTGRPGDIPCTLPSVFADVQVGERVLFDDGRISGVIRHSSEEALKLEITGARAHGSRLRSDKGINFPDSRLKTPSLTGKDLEDLAFATRHADIVNYSFVNREADIEALHAALAAHGRDDLAVVLKIETRRAFLSLPRLLLAAMRYPAPLGVMIARGDLAIECGFDELAEIQEEILGICAAAHVPCIWATQVLDEMARHGTPTRAEITDAAMGARAGALMLNKGPNITETVRTLRTIVRRSHPDQLVSCLEFRTNC